MREFDLDSQGKDLRTSKRKIRQDTNTGRNWQERTDDSYYEVLKKAT